MEAIRQIYDGIANLCKETGEPVYLTKNGEGELVVMEIEAFVRREKMLQLREKLLGIERDRLAGATSCTAEELNQAMTDAIRAAQERSHA
jgi:PHD/YefM family antitoxin component YafN of YafNO toxin-antitoxin module